MDFFIICVWDILFGFEKKEKYICLCGFDLKGVWEIECEVNFVIVVWFIDLKGMIVIKKKVYWWYKDVMCFLVIIICGCSIKVEEWWGEVLLMVFFRVFVLFYYL